MNRKTLGGLIVLNLVLLGALALVSFSQPAAAQFGGPRPGDYVMIGASPLSGSNFNVVVITDLNNAVMACVRYNPSQKQIVPVAIRSLRADSPEGRVTR
jgi:hypothetical protein